MNNIGLKTTEEEPTIELVVIKEEEEEYNERNEESIEESDEENDEESDEDGDLVIQNNLSRNTSTSTEGNSQEEYSKFSVSPELCVQVINKTFNAMMIIGGFLIIIFWIADSHDYNMFPFKVNPASSWWYQVGQVIFLASYWTKNMLLLRVLIILGYAFFIGWAIDAGGLPSMDFYLFTYIYVIINLKQIIELIYSKRPIEFDLFRENIYEGMFKAFMTRSEFQDLTKTSLLRDLQKNTNYCQVRDRCNNLSILVIGKIRIFQNDKETKDIFINENEFIDSAEWLLRQSGNKKGRRFTYAMRAEENVTYMTWPREILLETLKNNPELEQKLLGALGIDVSNKVFNHSSLFD